MCVLLALLAAGGALAQAPYDRINRARAAPSCDAQPASPALRRNDLLEQAAALLSKGSDLAASLKQAGYRASRSSVARLASNVSTDELVTMFVERQCLQITDANFMDLGIHLEPGSITVLLAAPFAPQVSASQEEAGQQVLAQVNLARAVARQCGEKSFAAAKPLRYNNLLALASLHHATDMARNNYFSHDGRDGANPAQRVERAGYRYRSTGENIAAGMSTAQAAVEGWIKSPPHCANLMNAVFTEMGVAYAINPTSAMGIYWAQAFGLPR
ncbi:MAG: CAP domain-containing protein [Burkholderiales bacterium]